MLRFIIFVVAFMATTYASAQDAVPSHCLAVAQDLQGDPELPPVRYARFQPVQEVVTGHTVTITFKGHSTYLIESPDGVRVATDFAGWQQADPLPTAITMNRAHSSHFTDFPNPGIANVFRSWGKNGGIARHNMMLGDVLIRNVTTDILKFGRRLDGNSIFIFEIAGLCIGHLGHLHHRLSDDHYARIGRLDIVMIAVDGSVTMSHISAKEILERMQSSIVLPMHALTRRAVPMFLTYLGRQFAVERLAGNSIHISLRTLPKQPTVMIMRDVDYSHTPK